jgi:hypothetical protein
MRFVTQVRSLDEIQTLKELGFRDALIEVKGLSCFGDLSVMDAGAIAKACVLADIRPVLVWDRLVEESKMQEMVRLSESMDLSVFSAIRVLDLAVLH